MSKNDLALYSNYEIVKKNARKFGYDATTILPSTRKDKKWMILDPSTKKYVHFGAYGMQDFTIHKDPKRRQNYLKRSEGIAGDWKINKYSPNRLARDLLW